MANFQLAYLTRNQAEAKFVARHADLMAGADEKAKRAAYYQYIHQLITGLNVDPKKAQGWQYPFLPCTNANPRPDVPPNP